MASLFKRKGAGNWIIQYFAEGGRRREQSSRTTDRRAAQRITNGLVADVALRTSGVVDRRDADIASHGQLPLVGHVADYLDHLAGRELSESTQAERRRILSWFDESIGHESLRRRARE